MSGPGEFAELRQAVSDAIDIAEFEGERLREHYERLLASERDAHRVELASVRATLTAERDEARRLVEMMTRTLAEAKVAAERPAPPPPAAPIFGAAKCPFCGQMFYKSTRRQSICIPCKSTRASDRMADLRRRSADDSAVEPIGL